MRYNYYLMNNCVKFTFQKQKRKKKKEKVEEKEGREKYEYLRFEVRTTPCHPKENCILKVLFYIQSSHRKNFSSQVFRQ